MTDPTLTNMKTLSMRAVMNNPKLSKLLFDAIKAPSGSLKKKQAQAVFDSFKQSEMNYTANKNIPDGQGGVGLNLPANSSLTNPLAKYAPAGLNLGAYQNVGARSIDPATGMMDDTSNKTPIGPREISPSSTTTSFTLPNVPTNKNIDLGKYQIDSTGKLIPSTGVPNIPRTGSIAPTTNIDTSTVIEDNKIDLPSIPNIQETDSEKVNYETITNIESIYGSLELDSWFNGLSSIEQAKLKPAYDAVKLGQGADTFAASVLSNKNQLAELLNLPKEVIDQFPSSGLLSDSLKSLQDSVTQKYNLDKQLNKLTSLFSSNLSVERDVTNYIKMNDNYLMKLDDMRMKFKEQKANADTSDPNVKARMDGYGTYLDLLAGRQNSRYMEMLTAATTDTNIKLQQANNLYQTTLTQANKEYSSQAAITTEVYDSIKGMLGDMYTNIEDRTGLMRENETYQLNKFEAAIRLQKLIDDTISSSNDSYDTIKQKLESSRGSDVTSENPEGKVGQGYVDSDVYKQLRSKSDDKTGFDKNFSYLLNPNDPTTQSYFKAESQPAQWQLEAAIWQWLATTGKDYTDEEKASYIQQTMGMDPEKFRIYI